MVLLIIPLVFLLIKRMEGGTPSVNLEMVSASIGAGRTLTLKVSDNQTGIKEVWVALLKDGQETVLLEKFFPSANIFSGGLVHEETFEVPVDPQARGIKDGKAVLRLVVRDHSFRKWGKGNQEYQEHDVIIDTRAPDISVLNRFLNMAQGGSGLVIYKLSEDCPRSGVMVGDDFYPGYGGQFKEPLIRVAFIALSHLQGVDTKMVVTATDFAGNDGRTGLQRHINARRFKKDTISLPDSFLNWKMPEFETQIAAGSQNSILEKFLLVNRDLRRANYEEIKKIVSKTDAKLYWEGHFLRLPGSANRAGYADNRTYIYKGKKVDRQTHLGIDLASTQQSPVPAANSGKVVFADDLGIYGRTVIIDHGFGLFSMYSHLSSVDVSATDVVHRGDIIGKTGRTGMAGGDHLHFSMLVHHTFVNPVEWWDAQWIRNNILTKIESVQ